MTDASNCTLIGFDAAGNLSTGSSNTCIGRSSGVNLTTGAANTMLGAESGANSSTATNCVHVGYNAGVSNESFSITIGTDVTSYGSYYVTLGTNSNGRVYNQYSSNATWSRTSDERKKKDVFTNTDCGLNFINDLRTVTYKWKAPSELPNTFTGYDASITEHSHKEKMYGFIAQEVKSAMDKHGITDFAGWTEDKNGEQGISYEMFVMPLVKSIQELSAENTALKARLDAAGL